MPSPDILLPAEGSASISFNGGTVVLDPQERAVMAVLLTHGTRQIADLPLLSELGMETVRAAVSSLARRSLVLLVEG